MRQGTVLLVLLCTLGPALAGCIDSAAPREDPDDTTDPGPFVNGTFEHKVFPGRLMCAAGSPAGTVNPCFFEAESRNVFTFSVGGGIETLVVGMTWNATTDLGTDLQLLVESNVADVLEPEHLYLSLSGPSQLEGRVDDQDIKDRAWSWENVTSSQAMQARVFAARTVPPTVIVDQSFDLHVAVFYEKPAPAGVDVFSLPASGNTTDLQ